MTGAVLVSLLAGLIVLIWPTDPLARIGMSSIRGDAQVERPVAPAADAKRARDSTGSCRRASPGRARSGRCRAAGRRDTASCS